MLTAQIAQQGLAEFGICRDVPSCAGEHRFAIGDNLDQFLAWQIIHKSLSPLKL
jgi:hypothetical protein